MKSQRVAWLLLAIAFASTAPVATRAQAPASPLNDPNFFPLAVWLQSPNNAAKYKAAGINTYVGLWRGPTEEQLATQTVQLGFVEAFAGPLHDVERFIDRLQPRLVFSGAQPRFS